MLVLVGSEYYEIPIFIKGYLFGPTPDVLHHVITTFLLIILLWFQQVKLNQKTISLLMFGPVLTAPILYFVPKQIYLARMIGLTTLFLIVKTSSEGVGGKSVSNKP